MFSHGPPRLPSRCRPPLSRMPFLHPVLFHFVPAAAPNAANIADGGVPAPNGQPVRRDPVSRVSRPRARPSARVSAGAVRAPDCACARERPSAGRTSPLRFDGIFSRRRRREGKRPPDAASSRQSGRGPFGCQAKLRIFSASCEHRACNAAESPLPQGEDRAGPRFAATCPFAGLIQAKRAAPASCPAR